MNGEFDLAAKPRLAVATLVLLGASGMSVAMLLVRAINTHQLGYRFLIWNLFLAWVPLLLAWAIALTTRRRELGWLGVVLGVPWLLFLPNAPYIVTDFVHLGRYPTSVPQWFDATMIGLFAATGLLLGYLSLAVVHSVVAQATGAKVGWLVAVAALGLSTIGVYLGRVHRFNSWDALIDPTGLLKVTVSKMLASFNQPLILSALLGSTLLLIGGYAATRNLVVRRASIG